jgi:hypothetical protein
MGTVVWTGAERVCGSIIVIEVQDVRVGKRVVRVGYGLCVWETGCACRKRVVHA